MQLSTNMRLAARAVLPQRNWAPIDAWDDARYHQNRHRFTATADELEAQRIASRDVAGPMFSIIVPLFRTPLDYLSDMAESVLAQTYPNFELVLVNASPEIGELSAAVSRYAGRDERVKVVTLGGNQGITENTNRGIEAATGDFVCFLDHDDWIEPDTLFEFAAAICEHGDIDLMYCDEDLAEKEGGAWRYLHPLFKPDFSPELLLCKNYVTHMLTVRKSIVDRLPKPGGEFDGTQDYNMTFMVSEQARRIHHVPKVLYHWRISENSTAANSAAKPYGKRAYRLSVQRHLERTGTPGHIIGSGIVNIHNIWFSPASRTSVSVIVAQAGQAYDDPLRAFLEAFMQVNTYDNIEMVLVGSERALAQAREGEWPGALVFADAEPGASTVQLYNLGAQRASGDVLVFLDSSCLFATAHPIEQIVGLHGRAGVGIVAPRTLYADYSVKAYGVGVSRDGIVPLYRGYALDDPSYQCNMRAFQNVSAVGHQGLSIRRGIFEEIGGFSPDLPDEISSAALCRQTTELGHRIVAACTIGLLTAEAPPARSFDERANRPDYPDGGVERFFEKFPGVRTATDPYRSPHLDLRSEYPVIDYRPQRPS